MAKKRKSTGISDLLFNDVDPFGAVIGEPASKPIERFPLDMIQPDPEQPRRNRMRSESRTSSNLLATELECQ